eukprot:scpid88420/ scgid28061/ 
MSGDSPSVLSAQTVEEMAVVGQQAVREVACKFQQALQSFNNTYKTPESASNSELQQERIALFQEQITSLHGTVDTIRSAYQSCLRSPASDNSSKPPSSLPSEKERLIQELHEISAAVQEEIALTRELLWTLSVHGQQADCSTQTILTAKHPS